MNRDVIIINESIYHGNTARLAHAMAQRANCMVINTEKALSIDLSTYKVVGLGSGIYFTSLHPNIYKLLDKLSPTQKTFIFSTHGSPILGKYHSLIKNELLRREITLLGEFSTRGYDCTGPFIIISGGNKGKPDERDERRAVKFISKIIPQYIKVLPFVPKGHNVFIDEDCIVCGNCISICPMNVLTFHEGRTIVNNEKDCTHCSLCLSICPSQAISLRHSFIEAIQIAKRHAKKTSL